MSVSVEGSVVSENKRSVSLLFLQPKVNFYQQLNDPPYFLVALMCHNVKLLGLNFTHQHPVKQIHYSSWLSVFSSVAGWFASLCETEGKVLLAEEKRGLLH